MYAPIPQTAPSHPGSFAQGYADTNVSQIGSNLKPYAYDKLGQPVKNFQRTPHAEFFDPIQSALHTYRDEVMQAAQRRDVERLKHIIMTSVRHQRFTATELNQCLVLHHVAWTGELNDVAKFLLSLGCDPYFPDINGDTVFHYVVRGCNLRLLRELHVLYGSRILEVLNHNHFNLFLTVSAETSDENPYDILNMIEWLYLSGCSLESQDANGKTGLMWACQRGSLMLVQWFLARGANLSHRDHNGRTVLQIACLSGDTDTVRVVCETGAISLLHCESNDDPESNTALKLCWSKGHFFLGFSLWQWYFQKSAFGCMRVFRNLYAWYYWSLNGYNFCVFLAISLSLVQRHHSYWYYCSILFVLFFLAQISWIFAFASDPGYVKKKTLLDQSYRCSSSFRHDLNQKPVMSYRMTSACYKFQVLEREMCKAGAELTALNRHYGVQRHGFSAQLSPDTEKKFEGCVLKIQLLREEMFKLMDSVGAERRLACPQGYAKQVMEGNPRKLCLTCRIVKPFRAHHCGDCAHCVHRFDHHCIWIDNCVGQENQRSFLIFLFSLTLSIIYFWFIIGVYYKAHLVEHLTWSTDIFKQPLSYVALTTGLFNLLWAGFVGFLCMRTCKSMFTNITFYEYLKKPGYIQKRFNGSVNQCLWDTADIDFYRFLRNIYSFCTSNNYWDSIDYPNHTTGETIYYEDNVDQCGKEPPQLIPMLE